MNAVTEQPFAEQYDVRHLNSTLDEILKEWHCWSAGDRVGCGYSGRSASCVVGPSAAMQWEIADLEAVDAVIDRIDQPHRTALAFNARNLNSRAQVWSSPRLPIDQQERQVLLMEARNKLARGLLGAGLL